MKLYEDLKWRGLIKDVAGNDLEDKLNNEIITFYWGTDPTADSLHLGHYSSLVTAKRLAQYGHHPILLIGGATGLIGDPRPTSEREIISKEELARNLKGLTEQVSNIFKGNVEIVNNNDWISKFNLTDFLREVGKYINVNYMLDKDIINRRLSTGITFAEFAYTLIQGYDFLHLFKEKNCLLQAAGSDQWGNITTGLDLIKKKTGKEAYAFTMPWILDASGKKFGKSEGNALWLDENKTSSYELYQYLINSDDSKVIEYLKVFTFLSKEEIEKLELSTKENPHLREAHKALAREIITDLHGIDSYNRALKISQSLFSGNIKELSKEEIKIGFKDVPSFQASEENIVDFLVNNKIASSKREAREFINAGSIMINGDKIIDVDYKVTKDCAIDNEILVIRRGKKKYYLGIFE